MALVREPVKLSDTVAGTCVINVVGTQDWICVYVVTFLREIVIWPRGKAAGPLRTVKLLDTVAGTCVICVVETQDWICAHLVTIL